jgi:hypothetical protein
MITMATHSSARETPVNRVSEPCGDARRDDTYRAQDTGDPRADRGTPLPAGGKRAGQHEAHRDQCQERDAAAHHVRPCTSPAWPNWPGWVVIADV